MISVPQPQEAWAVPWAEHAALPWVQAMAECPQDPIHHAEGDVFIHTRMVLEEMAADPAWRALSERDRRVSYLGALLHDVAKPFTTKVGEDGRVHARGHSRAGAILTRRLLWEMGHPVDEREDVAALVAWHQHPYFLADDTKAAKRLARISQTGRCDLLVRLSTADIKGRICQDARSALDNIALFGLWAEELGCVSQPVAFPSDHARVHYFRGRLDQLGVDLYDDTAFEVFQKVTVATPRVTVNQAKCSRCCMLRSYSPVLKLNSGVRPCVSRAWVRIMLML